MGRPIFAHGSIRCAVKLSSCLLHGETCFLYVASTGCWLPSIHRVLNLSSGLLHRETFSLSTLWVSFLSYRLWGELHSQTLWDTLYMLHTSSPGH